MSSTFLCGKIYYQTPPNVVQISSLHTRLLRGKKLIIVNFVILKLSNPNVGFHSEKHLMLHTIILSLFFNNIGEADKISTILLFSLFGFVHFPEPRQGFSSFFLMENFQILSFRS